jgi:signal transduction histidine kinase
VRKRRKDCLTSETSQTSDQPCWIKECMVDPRKTKTQPLAAAITLREELATLVHDIRDPLGVILGYTEMLMQEGRTRERGKSAEVLERIHCSAQLIGTLLASYSDL